MWAVLISSCYNTVNKDRLINKITWLNAISMDIIGFPHSPLAPGLFCCHDLCGFIGLRAPYLDPQFCCLILDSPEEYHCYHRMERFKQTPLGILHFYFTSVIQWCLYKYYSWSKKIYIWFRISMNPIEMYCILHFRWWRGDSHFTILCRLLFTKDHSVLWILSCLNTLRLRKNGR